MSQRVFCVCRIQATLCKPHRFPSIQVHRVQQVLSLKGDTQKPHEDTCTREAIQMQQMWQELHEETITGLPHDAAWRPESSVHVWSVFTVILQCVCTETTLSEAYRWTGLPLWGLPQGLLDEGCTQGPYAHTQQCEDVSLQRVPQSIFTQTYLGLAHEDSCWCGFSRMPFLPQDVHPQSKLDTPHQTSWDKSDQQPQCCQVRLYIHHSHRSYLLLSSSCGASSNALYSSVLSCSQKFFVFNFSLILTWDFIATCFSMWCSRETQGVVLTVKINMVMMTAVFYAMLTRCSWNGGAVHFSKQSNYNELWKCH